MKETAHHHDNNDAKNLERQLNDFKRIQKSLIKVLGFVEDLENKLKKNSK